MFLVILHKFNLKCFKLNQKLCKKLSNMRKHSVVMRISQKMLKPPVFFCTTFQNVCKFTCMLENPGESQGNRTRRHWRRIGWHWRLLSFIRVLHESPWNLHLWRIPRNSPGNQVFSKNTGCLSKFQQYT